jgi:hypothetical protein
VTRLLRPENHFVFTCPLLILELTYLDRDLAKAHEYGHIHLQVPVERFTFELLLICVQEVVEHFAKFQNR